MRTAQTGDIVELRDGKFFIGDEIAIIPNKRQVLIRTPQVDIRGWWRATLCQVLKEPNTDQSAQLESPYAFMTEWCTIIDCLEQGIKQIEILPGTL
jgi:hypothetical protein